MLLRELRHAARTLRKAPAFTATAILTIALGMGATSAIFSVVNAVLLRPLPYRNPDRLVFVPSDMTRRGVKDFPLSNADFLDVRNGTTRVFEDLAAVNTGRQTVPRQDGTPELIHWARATPNFLRMIGAEIVVIAFTALAALVAAAVFGLVPAIRASRPDVASVLRAVGRSSGLAGGGWLRDAVVVAEVALAFVLLVGCGLMFRSFRELQRIDPGFNPRGLVTFQLLGGRGQQPEQRAAFQRDIASRLSAIPGVRRVTASNPFPLTGGFSPIRWGLEPALTDPTRFQAVDNQFVLPGYFETVETKIVAGRGFTDADNARDRAVAVIDQVLAAKAFPGSPAAGKRLLVRVRSLEPEWVEVIGVAAHQRQTSLAEPGREQIYFADGYVGHGAAYRWALRVEGDPAQYLGEVRAAVAKAGANLLVHELEPMSAVMRRAQSATRFNLLLIGVFSAIAALLAAVGLYGVLSTVVRQRTSEIGVRMALGAEPRRIFGLVVGRGLRLSAAGVACGLLGAVAFTRVMTSMLVGVKPTDPPTFLATAALFFAVAAAASWLPARRAAGLDPTVALREE
jgi:predicted permease